MRKSWLVIGISLLTVLAVALVACGGGGGSKKTATPTATKAATKVATKATARTPEATSGAPATKAPTAGAGAGPTVKTTNNASLGTILTDGEGRTVYKFDNDQPNVSNCQGSCAQLWPPLTVASGTPTAGPGVTGALGTIQRSDGTTQVTLGGTPLYRFSNDTAPGDTKGDGFAGHWSVVKIQ